MLLPQPFYPLSVQPQSLLKVTTDIVLKTVKYREGLCLRRRGGRLETLPKRKSDGNNIGCIARRVWAKNLSFIKDQRMGKSVGSILSNPKTNKINSTAHKQPAKGGQDVSSCG